MDRPSQQVVARLAELDRPIAWLARLLGVNRSTATRWLSEGGEIPVNRRVEIALVLGKPRDWLAEQPAAAPPAAQDARVAA